MNYKNLLAIDEKHLDQMIDWIEGNLTSEKVSELTQLIEQNPIYSEAYKALLENYVGTSFGDTDQGYQKSWNIVSESIKSDKIKQRTIVLSSFAAAAMLLLSFFSGWFINQISTSHQVITAKSNEFIADTLENGGVVYLYPSSTLDKKVKKNSTELTYLEGDAFFSIPEDAGITLSVKRGKSDIVLKGSSFRISQAEDKDEIKIQVENGICEIIFQGKMDKKLVVNAGETAFLNTKSKVLRKEKVQDDIYLIYQPGM